MVVDVLLPFYGDFELMRLAVDSVLKQDNPNWRLHVQDDGHPDTAVAAWFATLRDERVRYARNSHNVGANANYNLCLRQVRHELVVVMGADDIMLPNYVSVVLGAHAAAPSASIIQPGVEVIDGRGRPCHTVVDLAKSHVYKPRGSGRLLLSGEPLAASLLRGNWLYFPSLCWRADAIAGRRFRSDLHVVQDLALAIDVIAEGGSLLLEPAAAFQYRRHQASDSSWRALEGTRFVEEKSYFLEAAAQMDSLGWSRAARMARMHVSSRINASLLLPRAIMTRRWKGARTLARHLLT